MSPKLFIGLVTHAKTRFPEASREGGLAQELVTQLNSMSKDDSVTQFEICDRDLFEPEMLDLSRMEVLASIRRELYVESKWRRYLDPQTVSAFSTLIMRVRHLYRVARYAPPWRRILPTSSRGVRMLTRLANIELAHLQLLRMGVDSGSSWILILEDDAYAESISDLGLNLDVFLSANSVNEQPKYVNLSRSFTSATLGIDSLAAEIGHWSPGSDILATSKPVTNTVCAILYRGSFAKSLLDELQSISLSPIIPIDWKINLALMQMFERDGIGTGDCWLVHPAPILQGSMHAPSGARLGSS